MDIGTLIQKASRAIEAMDKPFARVCTAQLPLFSSHRKKYPEEHIGNIPR